MTPPSSRPLHVLLLTALCCTVLGFNVDVKKCTTYTGPEGSMFGFSVAQHKMDGRSWLLIGAPEAQTSQPNVHKGGAVYKCRPDIHNACEIIHFDTRGNNNSTKLIQLDNKSRQWFGATVRSSGNNGVILACAPRYVYYSNSGERRDPVGTCYVTKNFENFSEYSPCRTRNWGHHKQGTCQAGLGASVSKDGERLFIGAVGSWFWQGQLYSVNSSAQLPFLPAIQYIMDDFNEGQFYSQSLYSRPEVLSTNEGPSWDDDSYLGYSVAVGAFGFGYESGAAVGMPRGGELLGKVVLYSTNLTNLYNITGDQLGAYFGYSICVADVDGDGGDDIVVGAPMFTEYYKKDGSYETGKVYVYLKKEGYKFNERNTMIGFNSKSRFGLALSGLGDINKDGYDDIAVGAPYDGPYELGAVYIYHGTKEGIRKKYSQVIKSKDVSPIDVISTFGFSLSGGMDLDNNNYPDLIIGAYESDRAFFLKSRPVVQMTTFVNFDSRSKQIALELKNCTTKDGTLVSCLFLNTSLKYTGISVGNQLIIEMQLILDVKKPKSPRMFFMLKENSYVLNRNLILYKNENLNESFNVYLKNNITDKLTSLEAELRYRIIEDTASEALTPIIDFDNELFAFSRDSISIQKNCGIDNLCIPNLRLIATTSIESFTLGSNEKLKIDVIVQNEGEDSFETTFDMTVPLGVNYVKIERVDDNENNDIPVQCSAPSEMTNHSLHCDIGNPLPRDKSVKFKVVLEPSQTIYNINKYEFNMVVNSTNPENYDSVSDNTKYLKIPLKVKTNLIIEGSSKPVDVHYNTTVEDNLNITDEKQIGPQVIHIYHISNNGPSDIIEIEAYIDWPLFTLAGEPLLYLLEMPETNGHVKCVAFDKINPFNLKVDHKKKSYFESSGLITGGTGASVTTKGDGSSSSSGTFVTGTKTYEQLTEEEKRRFLEIQRKDEESMSQWGDGSYEQKIRYQNTKSESGVNNYDGVRGSKNSGASTQIGSIANTNRGSTFNAGSSESGGAVYRNEYSNSKSTVVTAEGGIVGETSAGTSSSTKINRGPTFTVGTFNGGNDGTVHNEYESRGTSSFGSYGGSASSNAGGGHRVVVQGGASGSSATRGSNVDQGIIRHDSSVSRGAYGAAHFDETEVSMGSSSSRDASSSGTSMGSNFRGGSTAYGESSSVNVEATGSHYGGGGSDSHGRWLSHDNRGNSGGSAAGSWNAGGKNFTSFHESETSHVANTTWGSDGGSPRTYVKDQWRINDDGYVRNGSSSRVEHGGMATSGFDYRGVVRKMNTDSGATNVVSSGNMGDNSDLHVSMSSSDVNDRQNQGFRQRKIDESETVQKWRTVNGKLYRVNNVDDWNSLLTDKDVSTEVYEGQDYNPQNYRKPNNNNNNNNNNQGQDVDGKFKLYRRFKRDMQTKQCGPTRCATVKCTINPLPKDQEVWLSFRSRAWVNTLKTVAQNRPVTLSSTISAKITKLPDIGKPDNQTIIRHEVFTQVIPRDFTVKPDIIPLWIVVLSAVAGTAILLFLVYLLFQCGFFKRNRPSSAPEKQPLTNRNGQNEQFQEGDEAL